MWIFTTKGFYSIVQSPVPGRLLVRARFEGDIQKLIPDVGEVSFTPERDYAYRAIVPSKVVQNALDGEIDDIDYPNFKDAVLDDRRHPAYGNVWTVMYNAGDNRPRESWWFAGDSSLTSSLTSRRPASKKRRKNHKK